MCGVIGIYKSALANDIRKELQQLFPVLGHRGPDEYGTYAAPGIGFGHTRLSIIDLSNGAQPMVSPYSALAYNGEIFNYLELRRELEAAGCRFRTNSDTEVVQQALELWGSAALPRFNGQFALLFWDKRRKRLLIARDRYAIRPLYYTYWQGGYYFSSELKVFDFLPGYRRSWNYKHLLEHGLLWNTLGDATVFQGIQSLEGGHFQYFDGQGSSNAQCYYQLGEGADFSSEEQGHAAPEDIEAYAEELHGALRESVRLRLQSDVPVGCYLSGGIDSSVTSLLAKQINKQSFKSFSVSFADPEFDESNYQALMVGNLQFDHHDVHIHSSDIQDNFFDSALHFERPVFRAAPVPLYMLSREVRKQGIRVVLTGEAADEILFGYDTYRELKMLSLWKSGADDALIKQYLLGMYPHLSHYKNSQQAGFLNIYYEGFLDRFDGPLAGLSIRVSNNQILAKMMNKDLGLQFDLASLEDKIDGLTPSEVKTWDVLRRNQYWEMKTLLSGYLLSSQGDRMAMSHGIEGRFPFMDHNIVEWALRLPEQAKLQGLSAKHVLKRAFASQLPEEILNRPKRPYMAPDLPSFFPEGTRGTLVQKYMNSGIIREYGIFDPKMVERFLFKLERRGLESAGYRDNMLVCFMLSTQIIEHQIRSRSYMLRSPGRHTIDIIEDA